MAWFAWQSALFILLAFVLGCLVGYWYWRIQYRKAAFTESEAVTVISRRHEKAVAEKDAEIGRLQSLLTGGAGAAAVAGSADATDGATAPDADGDAGTSTDTDATEVTAEAEAVVDGAGGAEGDDAAPTTDATADGTSAEVTAADGTDAEGTDAGTAGADAADADTDAQAPDEAAGTPDAEPVTVVALPEGSDLPEETVVDVTDDAVAATDQDAVANAVAQLPTQSTGEGDVIDLSAVEDGAGADGAAQDATVAGETAAEPVADGAPDDGGAAAAAAPGVAAGLVSAAASAAGADDDTVGDDSAEDDLERIEGIGPRIASALRSAGIRSFRRLADADVPTLQAALEAAGLRFAPSLPTWSRQARFLADGDEVGFIKLTESLVAGREPGRSR